MINGEGTRAKPSDVASPDPHDELSTWLDQKLDHDDASNSLSDYSSCGEEFERYCSANSVMGTASLCSSVGGCNDFLDSDFGAIKNLGFGKSFGDRSFSTRGFDCLNDGRIEFQKEEGDTVNVNEVSAEEGRASWRIKNWSKSLPSYEGNSSLVGFNCSENGNGRSRESKGESGRERRSCDVSMPSHLGTRNDNNDGSSASSRDQRREKQESQFVGSENNEEYSSRTRNEFHSLLKSTDAPPFKAESEENFYKQGHGDLSCFHRLGSDASAPFDGGESGRMMDEEEPSVRRDYSDDDDSILSYGTDDERRLNLHYHQEPKSKNENPLLINSAVAFGADDWDEFIEESEHNDLASTLLDKPGEQQQWNLETEGMFVDSVSVAPTGVTNAGWLEREPILRDVPEAACHVNGTDEFKEDWGSHSTRYGLAQKDLFAHEASGKTGLNDGAAKWGLQCASNEEVIGFDESDVSKSMSLGKSKLLLDPLADVAVSQLSPSATEGSRGKEVVPFEGHEVNVLPSTIEDNTNIHAKTMPGHSYASVDQVKNCLAPIKVDSLDSNESYNEIVLEMEEILLDSTESHGARFPQSNRPSPYQQPHPFRDGSSTASTSGTDDPYPQTQHSIKVDWIEVVGAKQKKGDVSLGERIVGVKEYTVYLLRVWSGKDQWEVERRYRDFFTLYRQLKTLFAEHGWTLPSPWSRVEQESRKIFGNASPDVVNQRSFLIQECLRSILHSGCPSGTQNVLIWFLTPQKAGSSLSMLSTLVPRSASAFTAGTHMEDVSTLGKTISLLVENQPRKPVKQLLEAQHYSCAGCHKRLDAEKTLMREFVETLGWGKPRLCEYTGQLFCASCHTNDSAVLPARVLHFWDFTEYPVSQLAKSYLDSIYDQPMLCVSAVNPFLFSKVPALLHVMNIRKKIGAMMPYVRCPFRRSIQRGVGSRRYILESNEFFALRDLVDLSKGAFAALPVMIETILKKILEHITQQCLVCCDVGIPCGAKQACEDPSSLIFPFQEDEVKRCSSCQAVFHKPCFRHLSQCSCGASFNPRDCVGPNNQVNCSSSNELEVALDASPGKTTSGSSSVGFLSSLFGKVRQEKVCKTKRSNPVILMGSLPSTFSDPL